MNKPTVKPASANFSCGPCTKPPGWSMASFSPATLGRSHRSSVGKARLQEVIDKSTKLLGLPEGYKMAIVPASDTGAVEMAMWSLLGARGLTVMAWENFSNDWAIDAASQLKLPNTTITIANYGELPNLSKVDFSTDVVFPWNGTTSGVRVPNGDWIPDDREGLTICDATSAVFAMEMPWEKLDVVTYSWQKVMGGEAQHGMLILSPRAIARLESYTPTWPLPKLFRMTNKGKLSEGIFKGETINTPSMLCVEDALVSLNWIDSIGGVKASIARTNANAQVLFDWMEKSAWAQNLALVPATRSTTSICLTIKDPWFTSLPKDKQEEVPKKIVSLLDKEGVAYDIGAYRTAPLGLRIWAGATVEASDLQALCPWLDWAYEQAKASISTTL